MQNEASQAIVKRFFEAINELKARKIIRGKQTFARRYDINSRNFWQLERDHSRDIMQLSWLAHLVADYGVSAEWLLTGKGTIFVPANTKRKHEKQTGNDNQTHGAVPPRQGTEPSGRETALPDKVESQ